MTTDFKGGFASFVDGFQKSQDRTHERSRQAKNDAWVEEGQKQKRVEWDRDAKAQAKADALTSDLEAANAPVESTQEQAGPVYQDATGAETPLSTIKTSRAPTRDEQLDRAATAYSANGNVGEYIKLSDAAHADRMRSSADAFRQLNASAGGLSTKDLTAKAIDIFNNDPGVGRIENPVYGADGSVSFTAVNKQTGQKIQKKFSDPKQLLSDLHGYYSPKTFDANQAELRRVQAEAQKPFSLTPGEQRVIPGGPTYTNSNASSAEKAATIRAAGQGIPGVGGSKGGKAPLTGKDKALAAVEDKFKNDMDPSALTRVRNYVSNSYDLDPSIDDNQRVLAAEEASTNPASTSPRLVFGAKAGIASTHINAATGVKTPLYRMPSQYTPTPQESAGFKSDVAEFVATENRSSPGFGDLMLNAARGDKTAAAALPDFVTGRVKERWMAEHPLPSNMPIAQKTRALAELDARVKQLAPTLMRDVGQSLNLIKMYGLK